MKHKSNGKGSTSRWDNQKKLVEQISKVTTMVLPDGEGVALRFINQDVDDSSSLSLEGIGQIIENMKWQDEGNTQIGTYLRSKILQPLVYNRIDAGNLERPLLISILTDGKPSYEEEDTLVNVIVDCGRKLEDARLPRESKIPFTKLLQPQSFQSAIYQY